MDYKGLNKVIIKNYLALLLISKILNHLIGSKKKFKLDLMHVYYRLYIYYGNKWKTAFYIYYNHFKYLILPFRLTNRLVTF